MNPLWRPQADKVMSGILADSKDKNVIMNNDFIADQSHKTYGLDEGRCL